ncbi:MAG: HAD hydrolase family protein [Gemmatimonadetes bacterium]|jgi:3-deoxy-D-manno-octulosonate 8-phosphate phosphatase (KDO 8-P phosphatase)|nr:HAD hydrolase family protein [Gemmatimonadota bacterium]MBP9106869.1 HAD hydrolase family protein [Gemmatimonadaceae bacterium]MBK6456524.1 HAD hydrolase family protein [Gemmatimonadota bacterium]MBK7835754.1 HAD hydrolase family protein [Gemmatimonadota bacterium]MBK9407101.1 HAD hydrolase family protein [Gemmatimonadota bacterium]
MIGFGAHADAPLTPAGVPYLSPDDARRVRFVGLDVDGVLTDGGIYLGDVGGTRFETKRYDIQDGLGIKMLQKAGIIVAIITGRVSDSVALRAAELGVDDLVQDEHARKLPALRRLIAARGIELSQVAFVGDDLPDLGVMRVVGLPVVVANGTDEVFRASRLRLSRSGGQGAVREFAELLLKARGEWDGLVESYVASREQEHPA